eukprot:9482187-Pyramimonas_sp.AAC.1
MSLDEIIGRPALAWPAAPAGYAGSAPSSARDSASGGQGKADEDDDLMGVRSLGFLSMSEEVPVASSTPAESSIARDSRNKNQKEKADKKDKQGKKEDGGTRKPGRKSRHLLTVMETSMKEYMGSADGEGYFGQAVNHRRTLERNVKDFGAETPPDDETPEDAAKRAILKKQAQAALQFSKAWAKHACFNKHVDQIYQQNSKFLALEPAAPAPYPQWVLRLALEAHIPNIESVEEFWQLLEHDNLVACGYASDALARPRAEMLSTVIATFVKVSDDFDSVTALTALIKECPAQMDDDIKKELNIMDALVNPVAHSKDEIETALALLKGSGAKFCDALKGWPEGDRLVEEAKNSIVAKDSRYLRCHGVQ